MLLRFCVNDFVSSVARLGLLVFRYEVTCKLVLVLDFSLEEGNSFISLFLARCDATKCTCSVARVI